MRYEDGKPVGVTQIVVSHQHVDEDLSSTKMRDIIEPYVRKTLPDGWIGKDTVWHVNPTGKFVIGGPDGDTGLTGRKIIVDTYGGAAPHGGGAFSGKDPTKVDRSAAYAARYLAKNVVAAGLADRCTIQLSYAIGVAKPLSIYVDTHGTGKVDEAKLEKALGEVMDLSPRGIRKHLDLNKPIYARTSAYGHFGRAPDADGGFSWEKTDLADAIKKAVGLNADAGRALTPSVQLELRSFGTPARAQAERRASSTCSTRCCRALALARGTARRSPRRTLFAAPVSRVWLEIGFGGGEHLIWQARANPDVGLIGCEPFEDGVVKALSAIERAASTTSGSAPTTRARCCGGCPTPRSTGSSSCFPTPGRRSGTSSGG